jgi:hypothetical protein
MAKRYIGEAVVNILYRDKGDYAGTVSVGRGVSWRFEGLKAAPRGFKSGVAYDSPEAYDVMAASAVSFASYFTSHNRGSDVDESYPPAEVADAISEASSWAMDDKGTYHVRRRP